VSQAELLAEAVAALDSAGVGYVLTGSLVSSLQGEPRATHDVDLVIEVDFRAIDRLVASFGAPRYFFDEIAARAALDDRGMFNLLDTTTGDKVDFWALTDSEFDRSRFARRIVTQAFGPPVYVTTPEDTVLQKLKWARDCGESERQLRDAVGICELQGDSLDERYLEDWASRLGITSLLEKTRSRAQEALRDR
jgi:hypothetical protein